MTPDERTRRGERAQALLENTAFAETMDACLVHCQMLWAATSADDTVSREMLFHKFTAVHSIRDMLKNFTEDGTRAEKEQDGDQTG
jgi:tRNA C32,U32 (ribose-2'-O)-methylase TrmJ